MSTTKRDIHDRTFAFAVRIVRLCQQLDGQPGVAQMVSKQLLRAGTSIGAGSGEVASRNAGAGGRHAGLPPVPQSATPLQLADQRTPL